MRPPCSWILSLQDQQINFGETSHLSATISKSTLSVNLGEDCTLLPSIHQNQGRIANKYFNLTLSFNRVSLWRGTSISTKLKFSLSSQNIKRLLTDKLKRTANFHDKLYKCKIFKKCKKTRYRCKNNKKCRNTKYIRKPLKETTTKANNLFRGSGILKLFN